MVIVIIQWFYGSLNKVEITFLHSLLEGADSMNEDVFKGDEMDRFSIHSRPFYVKNLMTSRLQNSL